MNSKDYRKYLHSKEWKMCREKILERDCHKCCKCGKTENLDVHHKYYTSGTKPWEYEDDVLVTLCRECHDKEHLMKHFIKKFNHHSHLDVYIMKIICNTFKPKNDLDEVKIKLQLYRNWKNNINSVKLVEALKQHFKNNFNESVSDEAIDQCLHSLRDKFFRIKYVNLETNEAYFITEPGLCWFLNTHKFNYNENGYSEYEQYFYGMDDLIQTEEK